MEENGIPAGTHLEGDRLVTGSEGGTCVLTAIYREGGAVFALSVPVVVVDTPLYQGPYTVTPSAVVQTLPTANTRHERNITVLPIPFRREENAAGGDTVTLLI